MYIKLLPKKKSSIFTYIFFAGYDILQTKEGEKLKKRVFNPEEKEKIGTRIRNIRITLNKTMVEFGEMLSPDEPVAQSIISRWERGISVPNNDRLKKIAEIGNVSTYYLLTGEKIDYLYGGKKEVIDFSRFKSPSKLLKYIISVNSISSDTIPEVFKNGKVLEDFEIYNLVNNYTDREIKSLSYRLSGDVLEQLLIHYRLCELFSIKSDISKLSSDDKYFYLSSLRQEYYYNKVTEKTIHIDTREELFDGETIVINGKTLDEEDKALFLNTINRLAD